MTQSESEKSNPSGKLRVAMLSRWHVHANEYAHTIQQNENAAVAAVWDEEAARGEDWARELNVPFFSDYTELLQSDRIDAVCVVAPTNMHTELMCAAAAHGKHIFTEKVLTTTAVDARRVRSAVIDSGIEFCISYPRQTVPEIRFAKSAIDQGLIGRVTASRIRIAHAGSSRDWLPEHFYDPIACGGGAMMDLGAHGMYLSRWLLGEPKRIVSLFNNVTDRAVEDNAISMIEFASGAIAVNETSFVAYPDSYSLEIDGTEGGVRMLSPRDGVQLRSDHADVKGWHTPATLPPRQPRPIDQWVSACHGGQSAEFSIDDAVALTDMMEAAYLAQRERRAIDLEEIG